MIGIGLVEHGHHFLKGSLAAGDVCGGREGKRHTERLQPLLDLSEDNVPQRHGSRTDLCADHLEPAGHAPRGFHGLRIGQIRYQPRVLSDPGNDRHQMRLACAVIADDQKPFVVGGLVVFELGEDQAR